ncbi:MAG: YaiO family outer membrane beta-barrel protein [Bacteroidales bacterium]
MINRRGCLLILLVCIFFSATGQESPATYQNPGEGFALMRVHAAEGQYEKAEDIGYRLLEENPGYGDVSLYLARVHGWQGEYDSAYARVEDVLAVDSTLLEAHRVLVDLAYWENDWETLAVYARQALQIFPDDPPIRGRYRLARYKLAVSQEVPEIYVFYAYDHFQKPYVRNWHMLTVGGNLPLRAGVLIPYINTGIHGGLDRPNSDIQLNLDSYLHLGEKNYLLAGYGISPGQRTMYLPLHRAALELWQVLPGGFSLSAGMRYFYWDRHFTFLTFSGEKYAGNYWFSLRNYLFFKDYGVSGSYYLSARRYFADRYNYVSATLGFGTAPDEPILVASDLDRLGAYSFRLGISWQFRYNLRLDASSGYAYEEYADREHRHRIHFRTGIYISLGK